jgi:two-component system LytT family response regulator
MQISQFMPDIIFLDIHMPGMEGFTLFSKIPDYLPEIVFIKAYQEYALKAFYVHSSGYLTKPIHTEKFQTCAHNKLNKLQLRIQQSNAVASRSNNNQWQQLGKIVIPIGKDSILINIGDLIFLESLGNYTRIYLQDHAPVLVCKQLGKFQQELTETHFCRLPHKYLVALFHVLSFSSGPD